jgi:hypothetical protein
MWRVAVVAGVALGMTSPLSAQNRSFTDRTVPGMQQADRHNPFSRNYTDMTPGGYARRQAGGYVGRGYPGGNYWLGGPGFFGGYYGPGYYGPGHFDHGHYDHHHDHYHGPWDYDYGYDYLPPLLPLTIPSESIYGPGALWNRMGVAPPVVAPPANNILIVPPAQNVPNKVQPQPRPLNAETMARVGRMLSAGDEHFVAQRYRDANQRYRTATETAPEMVEAYFRQGQALVALGQYDLAAKAYQRGLKQGPHWKDAEFKLDALYGDNDLAKNAHREALAAAAGEEPHNGSLLLLVGLQLYFDGQVDRARPFFERASGILADNSLNLDAVLAPPAKDANDAPDADNR